MNGTSSQGGQPFNESSAAGRDGDDFSIDGLICAFELTGVPAVVRAIDDGYAPDRWVPIGRTRISELILMEDENKFLVTDDVSSYSKGSKGPIWWCHVSADHHFATELLSNAQLFYPDTSIALGEQNMLISDDMQHFLYEVPGRLKGGLFFQLLAQSLSDPSFIEVSIPIVIKFWQRRNFLITVMPANDSTSSMYVPGIAAMQQLLFAGGRNLISVSDVMAQLIWYISRCDDRLFRKTVLYVADEIELKFVNRTINQDLYLHNIKSNEEINKLANKVIRIKRSLHEREKIILELLQHLHGTTTRSLLDGVIKFTREMLGELEVVHKHLFALQNIIQSSARIWLEEKMVKITLNAGILGGCCLILSIITSLLGINVDEIFYGAVIVYGFILIWCIIKFGYKKLTTL